MRILRFMLLIAACIIIIIWLFIIDYTDLSWENNSGRYLGIVSMIFVIMGMTISFKHHSNRK